LNAWSKVREKFWLLAPRSRTARFTAYLAGVELLLVLLRWIFRLAQAPSLAASFDGWIGFLGLVLWALVIFLALRWFRDHVMWSVRNRLIVTYLFIGVLPIVLVVLIVSVSVYFFAKQFAAYIAVTEISAQAGRLQAANFTTAQFMARRAKPTANQISNPEDNVFPGRTVSVLAEANRPPWLQDGFHGLVLEDRRLFLRAANVVKTGAESQVVVSSVPVDRDLVSSITRDLGPMTVVIPPRNPRGENNLNIELSNGSVAVNGAPAVGISSGTLPPPQNRWDSEFNYYSLIQPVDWKTGKAGSGILLIGAMRVSSLYSRLVASANNWANVIFIALAVLAGTFAVIVIVAWLIGIRLTRTLTYSVANLYKATQRINAGDFSHRIQVRQKDQLGALQTAFNSMTESVERLLAEQKEKERLQSELEIAHEVQSQLFPQAVSGTRTLEVYGVCRPAQIVSGDYYDFLAYNPGQVGIAVGDVSGKGISAALLMATIHSAIRAYEQEQTIEVSVGSGYGAGSSRASAVGSRPARPSPAEMLWLLNRHLYRTTQPAKYATLFLGFYDDEGCQLTYSNAGHLPPIILGGDGSLRRLDVGGTVVGLFDDVKYQTQTVDLFPGDLFIAFSDGMTEPENEYGEFGEDRLVETISTYRDLPLDRISEHALAAIQDWIGSSEQPDDVTLVLARRLD
jgi:phosphoserine phosphatase RsbU/P